MSFYRTIILVIYFMLQLSCVYCTKTSKLIGFSTYLIHRDSFESPLYDPSMNKSTLITKSIHRSSSRLFHLKSILKQANNNSKIRIENPTIIRSNWEYLMEISIGKPPVKQLAIADTGSSIIWTQCQPCIHCYKQIQPIFNPRKSLSYNALLCSSNICKDLRKDPDVEVICPPTKMSNQCRYGLIYYDNSTSYGVLSVETFKLSSSSDMRMVYGCSHDNRGKFQQNSAGIVGLGYGSLSFVGQLRSYIGGKFSYCLVHWSKAKGRSKINFGTNAIVSGRGVVSTPLVEMDHMSLYHVTLEAVSVSNTRISFNGVATTMQGDKNIVEKGNMVLDTGTITTSLPTDMFLKMVNVLRMEIKAKPVQDLKNQLKLCYEKVKNFKIPTITFHFAGGADVALETKSTMAPYSGLLCLLMQPDDDAMFGSLSQMDYLIGYDLEKMKVYFKPTIC